VKWGALIGVLVSPWVTFIQSIAFPGWGAARCAVEFPNAQETMRAFQSEHWPAGIFVFAVLFKPGYIWDPKISEREQPAQKLCIGKPTRWVIKQSISNGTTALLVGDIRFELSQCVDTGPLKGKRPTTHMTACLVDSFPQRGGSKARLLLAKHTPQDQLPWAIGSARAGPTPWTIRHANFDQLPGMPGMAPTRNRN
jgi:hypothetical protein